MRAEQRTAGVFRWQVGATWFVVRSSLSVRIPCLAARLGDPPGRARAGISCGSAVSVVDSGSPVVAIKQDLPSVRGRAALTVMPILREAESK